VAYSKKATKYKVRNGDTVGSIADDFQVPVDKVRKWNHLKGTSVAAGRTLLIYKPLSGSASPESAAASDDPAPFKSGKQGKSTKTAKTGTKPTQDTQATYHKVKKGETLSSIAHSYNTTVANLKKNNANASASLRPGEVLVISK
jgi:membrane-bound lytic murein transglycosylase D